MAQETGFKDSKGEIVMENRLTMAQRAMVSDELRAQRRRDGMRGRADIATRIVAAKYRYGYNRQRGRVARIAIGIVGMACVIVSTWRRRLAR